MNLQEILADIHSLEEDLLAFERKFGIRSETFFAAYVSGEEPENDGWVLDFGEWASVYRTWLARQADYRNEVQRLQKKCNKSDRSDTRSHMSNPLRTIEDYELFLYTLKQQFKSIRHSTVILTRRGASLARVSGEL